MGHANVTNLSELFIRQIYAKGKVSMAEVADVGIARGEKLHASEGDYSERYMLCMGLMEIVTYLLCDHAPNRKVKASPVIEACDMTQEQIALYNRWVAGDMSSWDCGDDGNGGEYGIFDSIKWKFAGKWRKFYQNVPILENVTN